MCLTAAKWCSQDLNCNRCLWLVGFGVGVVWVCFSTLCYFAVWLPHNCPWLQPPFWNQYFHLLVPVLRHMVTCSQVYVLYKFLCLCRTETQLWNMELQGVMWVFLHNTLFVLMYMDIRYILTTDNVFLFEKHTSELSLSCETVWAQLCTGTVATYFF